MGRQEGSWPGSYCSQLRDDFVDGLRRFNESDYAGALALFRVADECADLGDIFQSRYTSFHGLSRVCMGDSGGAKLCRKAAAGETRDAEVFYNLALAEYRLENRESAWMALRFGLRIDPEHPGLVQLQQAMTLREQRQIIPGLDRNHLVNRLLGRLFRGTRKPFEQD